MGERQQRDATIARHVADGFSVGLCGLTAGEMGRNGTPEERARHDRLRRALGTPLRGPSGGFLDFPPDDV